MNLELFEANLCFALVTRDMKCIVAQHTIEKLEVVLTPFLSIEILDCALTWNRDNIQRARETFAAITRQPHRYFMAAYHPDDHDIAEETKIEIQDPPPLTVVQISLVANCVEVA